MRVASIIVLSIIALLLLHIANELRKGKTVVLHFGRDNSSVQNLQTSTPGNSGQTVNQALAIAPKEVFQDVVIESQTGYNLGIAYGKSVLKGITG